MRMIPGTAAARWLLAVGGVAIFHANLPATAADGLVIRTKGFTLRVSDKGRVTELNDRASGRSYLPERVAAPFMRLRTEASTYDVSALTTRSGGDVEASFGASGLRATLEVKTYDTFATLTLKSLSSDQFQWLELVRLPVAITKTIATQINAVYDDHFAAAVMAAAPQTNAALLVRSSRYVVLGARCWPSVSTQNVSAVVLGCPAAALKDTIEKVELACGLPHPTIDGLWWKRSPEVRKGYLLCNPTGREVDKAIAYARRAGIPYITFLSGTWSTSLGHYPINKRNFPRGETDLKATVDRIHAQGMKAGMHFLSACISKRDAYVTPMPDRRLAKDGQLTLAEDIDARTAVVPTREAPTGFLTEAHYGTPGGVDIQIDDEIIRYGGLHREPPYGFTQCRRGAYGTRHAVHKAGATVWHLTQRYNMLLPDPRTDLVDEIAERLAHIYNTCGFDMVYFDGGEAMAATGPSWQTVSLIHRAFYKRARRPILWQGSGSTHYSWHLFCRGNCDDYACLDPKAYCDRHKTPRIERYYRPNFIAPELGWWGYLTHTPSYYATLPDDIIYMCGKAVGWDAAVNLEGAISALEGNGRTGETLDRMRIWQRLQHSNYFSDAIKRRLREPGMDFELVKDDQGRWPVRPVKYQPDHIVDPKVQTTATWTFDNRLAAGPIAGRIRAVTQLAPYGAADNVVLLDPQTDAGGVVTKASLGVTVRAELSGTQAKTDRAALKLTVARGQRARRQWAVASRVFAKPLNLLSHRPLGLWIGGDGQGQVVNVQVEDLGHRLRDHYIDVDFAGWRYFTLDKPASRRVWDYPWPYNRKWALRQFDYRRVRAVNVYVSSVPAGQSTTVLIGRIEALKESPAALTNPTLAIGTRRFTIPVTMQPDEYVEFDTAGRCRHFDPNGHLLGQLKCANPPAAALGPNTVRFATPSPARARVTVIVKGKPLQ